ncbi:MAG: tetratricopeptide repeat protein [Campylobacterales bacterium]|nr:tetratricopeptide repeat protein [Campylobacterales bacterium]
MTKLLTLLLLCMLSLNAAATQKKNADEIDHISLAALLLKDGFVSRASEELSQVDLEDEKIDKARFFTLKGLVATKQEKFAEANGFFMESMKHGEVDKTIYLYIAQNSFKLKDFEGALSALENAGDVAAQAPSAFALKAECLWQLKRADAALQTLKEGLAAFGEFWNFYKQRFNYFLSLGLYRSALDDARIYILNAAPDEKSVLSFIAALRKIGATDKAIELAEEANIRFYESAEITVMLAHLYLDKSMVQAAADLFNEASIEDSKYTKEAAEMMRRAREFTMSLYKNSQMLEQKEKLKQRIAIFVEFGAFERIVASRDALERSGLVEDESIRYALAYAYYMTGNYEQSEAQLKHLTQPDLFNKATELRKNMQKCKDNPWECES